MAAKIKFDLTESQENKIEELKRRMSKDLDVFKLYNETFVLYRFLTARDWDINRAELMLKKSVQWRRQNFEYILNHQPSEFVTRYFSNVYIGTTKDGEEVFFVNLGKCDVKGVLKSTKNFEVPNRLIQVFLSHEIALEQKLEKENEVPFKGIAIFDLDGLTLTNATNKEGVEVFIRFIKTVDDNFPERVRSVYLINTAAIYIFSINIITSVLSSKTRKKVHLFGKEGWKEALLREMDPDQLPACMGGTRTDPDGNPLCRTICVEAKMWKMGMGRKKRIHACSELFTLANAPGSEWIQIPRSSSVRIPVGIQDPGSVIEWQFETSSGDIGFGLLLETDGEQELEVVPLERRNTRNEGEAGMYRCERPGNYIAVFDNSYSWFRAKEVLYRIEVMRPDVFQEQIKGKLL